jgi:hypothetical protein
VNAAPPAKVETNATPQPPSGPVPIPYLNVVAKPEGSGKAQKISGKEVGLKNGSKLQKSTGD